MFNTLKSKFTLAFIIVEVVFLLVIISFNFVTLEKASDELVHQKIEVSTELFVALIKTPLAVFDLAVLDDAMESFSHIKNIDAVLVEASTGQVVSQFIVEQELEKSLFKKMMQDDKQGYTQKNKNFRFEKRDVLYEGEYIGRVYFLFNTSDISSVVSQHKILSIFISLIFIVVSFIVANFVGAKLGKSLEHLSKISQYVANDEAVDIPTNSTSKDEISTLFKNMKQMQTSINQRNKNLNITLNTLKQFVHAMDESAIVSKTTPDGIITFANNNFCETSGYSLKEIIGKTHNIISHPDNSKSFFQHMWQTITSKNVYHHTIKNRNKSGKTYYVDATILPLLDTQGNIYEYIAIRYEVTQLVEAKNKAQAAEKAKGEFLSNMSHEIRTPLNAILGFLHLLKKEVHDETAQSHLQIIENSSQSLLTIINDILDFSKIQSGKFTIETHSFEPLIEMDEAIQMFCAKARDKEIIYTVFIDPYLPKVLEGDLTRIKQILFNLLSNAFKFTEPKGSVRVVVSYDKASTIFSLKVTDTGIGISKEKQARIFNAFEQADGTTTRKFGGTGLGLSISSELAQLMHGRIEIDSIEGEGSSFTLELPLKPCEDSQDYSFYKNLSIATLYQQKDFEEIQALRYYLQKLSINEIQVHTPFDDANYDVLICVPDTQIEEKVKKSQKNTIFILNKNSNSSYEGNISILNSPFTSKSLLPILKPSKVKELTEKEPAQEDIQFQGKVLIAEDNKTNQMLIGLLLSDYGIDYKIANDGVDVLTMFKEEAWDLVLMDENMPNKNGLEAFKDIRAYEKKENQDKTAVVALTANVLEEDKKTFFEAGMDDFLAKPIDVQELERVLKTYLFPS
ncbi:response regulator [Sulfurimonas sp. MAG313]|nr:PAS domain-containing hybrid sensor histidine kinase/response regulator [Sulfurimonas sp. MAG313]MDF1879992.1 response regulator [Sulfurimonas sp. MAG313]